MYDRVGGVGGMLNVTIWCTAFVEAEDKGGFLCTVVAELRSRVFHILMHQCVNLKFY